MAASFYLLEVEWFSEVCWLTGRGLYSLFLDVQQEGYFTGLGLAFLAPYSLLARAVPVCMLLLI